MIPRTFSYSILVSLFTSLLSINTYAADTEQERYRAALRYLETTPVTQIIDDSVAALSKELPADIREEVILKVKQSIDVPEIEKIMVNGLVKVYTVEEINALADFYGSDVGQRVLSKTGMYLEATMPAVQQEIITSAETVFAQN